MCPENGELGIARKRRYAGQGLVKETAERVEIGAPVDLFALDLLRRDIGGRPKRESFLTRDATVGETPGQAEVGQVDVLLLIEEHVRGFNVSVHEPAGVRRVQRGPDLGADRDRTLRLQRSLLLQQRLQVGAFDEAHRDHEPTVQLTRVIDRHHIRMLERRRELRFRQEPLPEALVPGELRRDQLQRNVALQARVVGLVDNPHPAPAEERLDPIAEELRSDPRVG